MNWKAIYHFDIAKKETPFSFFLYVCVCVCLYICVHASVQEGGGVPDRVLSLAPKWS